MKRRKSLPQIDVIFLINFIYFKKFKIKLTWIVWSFEPSANLNLVQCFPNDWALFIDFSMNFCVVFRIAFNRIVFILFEINNQVNVNYSPSQIEMFLIPYLVRLSGKLCASQNLCAQWLLWRVPWVEHSLPKFKIKSTWSID